LHTPNPPQEEFDFSPEDESLKPQFNPATESPPIFMDEEEWLDTFEGILSMPTLFNPVTASFIEPDED
jgi:hypothetical protein